MSVFMTPVPSWVRWAVLAAAGLALYVFGRVDGERIAGNEHLAYVAKQAAQAVRIIQAQQKVVVQTEIKYRDRIQKIYVKGDIIEKEVPVYVTQADNARCTINAGFVRSYNAGWTGEPAGSAAESDREPAGISLADVGDTDAFNAKVCKVWREQALGWREYFEKMKEAIADPSHGD